MHLLEYQSTLVIHSPVPEKTFQGGAAKKCDLCLLAVCNRCHILSLFISASSQDFQLELGRQWPFRFSSQQRQHWIRQRPLATWWKDILLRPNIQSDKSHSLLAKIHSLAQDCRRCWCQSVFIGVNKTFKYFWPTQYSIGQIHLLKERHSLAQDCRRRYWCQSIWLVWASLSSIFWGDTIFNQTFSGAYARVFYQRGKNPPFLGERHSLHLMVSMCICANMICIWFTIIDFNSNSSHWGCIVEFNSILQ